jgi:hypothetical protein
MQLQRQLRTFSLDCEASDPMAWAEAVRACVCLTHLPHPSVNITCRLLTAVGLASCRVDVGDPHKPGARADRNATPVSVATWARADDRATRDSESGCCMVASALRKRPAEPAPVAHSLLSGGFHDRHGRVILGTPAPAACPFCTRPDDVIIIASLGLVDEPHMYRVTCGKCGAEGPQARSRRAAAVLWNQQGVTLESRLYRLLCGPGEA